MTSPLATQLRPKLSRERIVDALLSLARESPAAEVSFRTLGTALDVNATAVYRHFRDKDELYRAAVDRLYTEALARVDRSEPSWRARLAQYATALAPTSTAAPATGQLAPLIDGRGAGELASIDFLLEALEEAGLAEPDIIIAYGAFSGHTLALSAGMARELSREPGRAARGQDDLEPADAPWIKALDAHSLARFPRVLTRQMALLSLTTFEVYEAGVQAILDSISPR